MFVEEIVIDGFKVRWDAERAPSPCAPATRKGGYGTRAASAEGAEIPTRVGRGTEEREHEQLALDLESSGWGAEGAMCARGRRCCGILGGSQRLMACSTQRCACAGDDAPGADIVV